MQTILSKATLGVYAMESMIYLTAGIVDEFDKPDVVLESAITKVKLKTNHILVCDWSVCIF